MCECNYPTGQHWLSALTAYTSKWIFGQPCTPRQARWTSIGWANAQYVLPNLFEQVAVCPSVYPSTCFQLEPYSSQINFILLLFEFNFNSIGSLWRVFFDFSYHIGCSICKIKSVLRNHKHSIFVRSNVALPSEQNDRKMPRFRRMNSRLSKFQTSMKICCFLWR